MSILILMMLTAGLPQDMLADASKADVDPIADHIEPELVVTAKDAPTVVATASESEAEEKEFVLPCPKGQPCVVNFTIEPTPVNLPAPRKEVLNITITQPPAVTKEVTDTHKVPLLVKFLVLPLAGGLIGGGTAGFLYPDKVNTEDGKISVGAPAKGALVGLGAGLLTGFIIHLLDEKSPDTVSK